MEPSSGLEKTVRVTNRSSLLSPNGNDPSKPPSTTSTTSTTRGENRPPFTTSNSHSSFAFAASTAFSSSFTNLGAALNFTAHNNAKPSPTRKPDGEVQVLVSVDDVLGSLYEYGILPAPPQPVAICGYCLDNVTIGSNSMDSSTAATLRSSLASPKANCTHQHLYHKKCLEGNSNVCHYCGARKKMGTEAICQAVCDTMSKRKEDAALQTKGHKVITVLGYNNRVNVELLEYCNAPKLVCDNIIAHPETREVLSSAMEAIIVLCHGGTPGKDKLGTYNAPSLICSTMKRFQDKSMGMRGLAAIARLAELDPSNIMLFEWSEAIPLILETMKRNSLTRPVIMHGLSAIKALVHYDLQPNSPLLVAKGHMFIPHVLNTNLDDPELQLLGLHLLISVLGNETGCRMFEEGGLCRLITKIMATFPNDDAIQQAAYTLVTNVSYNSDLCRGLLGPYISHLIAKAIKHFHSKPGILVPILRGVGSLANPFTGDLSNAEHLGGRGVCHLVLYLIRDYFNREVSRDVHFECVRALNALAPHPSNCRILLEGKAPTYVQKLMKMYSRDDEFLYECRMLYDYIDQDKGKGQWSGLISTIASTMGRLVGDDRASSLNNSGNYSNDMAGSEHARFSSMTNMSTSVAQLQDPNHRISLTNRSSITAGSRNRIDLNRRGSAASTTPNAARRQSQISVQHSRASFSQTGENSPGAAPRLSGRQGEQRGSVSGNPMKLPGLAVEGRGLVKAFSARLTEISSSFRGSTSHLPSSPSPQAVDPNTSNPRQSRDSSSNGPPSPRGDITEPILPITTDSGRQMATLSGLEIALGIELGGGGGADSTLVGKKGKGGGVKNSTSKIVMKAITALKKPTSVAKVAPAANRSSNGMGSSNLPPTNTKGGRRVSTAPFPAKPGKGLTAANAAGAGSSSSKKPKGG